MSSPIAIPKYPSVRIAAIVLAGLAQGAPNHRHSHDASPVPADALGGIVAARYAVRPIPNAAKGDPVYGAVNPAQGMRVRFSGDGVELRGKSWRSVWALRSAGYGARQTPLGRGALEAKGNRMTIARQGGVTEWYVNAADGVEQGFTLDRPPVPARAGERLRLVIDLAGDLHAGMTQGKKTELRLMQSDGRMAMRYDHLTVIDREGRKLPAEVSVSIGNDAAESILLDVDDRGASWPVTIDPTFTQEAFLKAANPGTGDEFGRSIAMSGDTLVVGAPGEDSRATGVDGDMTDNSATDSGAVYVFVRNGTAWTQQAYLKASNTGAGDSFGYAVAISGDTIIVGAYKEASAATGVNADQTDNWIPETGAAYVFVRNGTTWSQQAYLKGQVPGGSPVWLAGSWFGYSVAIAGDTAVVGSFKERSNAVGVNATPTGSANESGASFVFVRSGSTWTQQAYLKASNATAGANMASVAISGETIVVGSECEKSAANGVNGDQTTSPFGMCRGAAYVFVRDGVTWAQQAYLKASNNSFQAYSLSFGSSVSIAGDTAVVGAPGESSNATGVGGDETNGAASLAGSAYVFTRTGTVWSQKAYLKSSNTHAFDRFGASVYVSGDIAVVGSPLDYIDHFYEPRGAAFLFQRTGVAWAPLATLRSPQSASSALGIAVSMSGDRVAAGGIGNSETVSNSGAAYVFAIVSNTPPGIVANAVSLTAGTSSNATIATVSDGEDAAGSLQVSVQSANPSNGVTLSGIGNSGGSVGALVSAACTASNASFSLRVGDSGSAYADATLPVTVSPSVPVVSASVSIGSLSPANSNLINVGLSASATGNCSPVLTVRVYSNEDDETESSPNTVHSPDAREIGSGTLRLRAERIEKGDGRVYLIVAKGTNSAGVSSVAATTVVVPGGQGQAQIAGVNAMAASAKAFALANNGSAPAGYFLVGDGAVIGPKQ
ncbi:MAG: hypothetical protein HYX27_14025 [Acidobacteria bacterium]|nr:hypothetical protein [Acidobacteriota bacterium]